MLIIYSRETGPFFEENKSPLIASIVIANQLFAKSWCGNLFACRLLRLRQLAAPRNDKRKGSWALVYFI